MFRCVLSFLLVILLSSSCGTDILQDQEWNIETADVVQGLPDFDDIPSIDNPTYTTISEVNLADDALVIVAMIDGVIKIYPVNILVYHEVINEANEALIYSTLTGSSNLWRRIVDGVRLDFGLSGYLYNNNVLVYDKTTNSLWSQILGQSVTGSYINRDITHINTVETTWATAKTAYPNAPVLSEDTGFARAYAEYPYGDYREVRDILLPFNQDYLDERIPTKESVLSIMSDSSALVYRYTNLPVSGVTLFEDQFEDRDIIVIGHKESNYLTAFYPESGVNYNVVENNLPVVFSDNSGNEYDLFGNVVSGPNIGTTLSAPKTMTGYWFVFPAFYPKIEIRN